MAFDTGGKNDAGINVTPLIDILLVLLITFLLIAPVTPKGEDAKVPRQSAPPPADRVDPVILQLDTVPGSSQMVRLAVNKQELKWNDLNATLGQIFKTRADKSLFVAAAQEVDFRYVAEAVDVAHAAGVDNVALMRMPDVK